MPAPTFTLKLLVLLLLRITAEYIAPKRGVVIRLSEGGVRGVRKPQNRTEIRQKTANRIGFFPEYRNRKYSWRDGMTGLRNSYLRVIAAKEVLLKKYIFKDLLLFYGTIGGSLNISLSNNPDISSE